MRTWIRLTAFVGAVLVAVMTFAACNTIRGAGQDIEEGGEAIQDAAQ